MKWLIEIYQKSFLKFWPNWVQQALLRHCGLFFYAYRPETFVNMLECSCSRKILVIFVSYLMTHWKDFNSFFFLSYQVRICGLWIGCSIRIVLISHWLVEPMNSKPARRAHSINRKIYFTQLLWGENLERNSKLKNPSAENLPRHRFISEG